MKTIKIRKRSENYIISIMKPLFMILPVFLAIHSGSISAQCIGTIQNPAGTVMAPHLTGIDTITTMQEPGEYFIIENLAEGRTYQFASSDLGDYITIRDAYDFDELITHGPTPLNYIVTDDDIISVHIHKTSPPCGTESIQRSTTVMCTDCASHPPALGVAVSSPSATLEVGGSLKLSSSLHPPVAGMIRWNDSNQDFEGFNGTNWLSLTRSPSASGFGIAKTRESIENHKLIATDGDTNDVMGYSCSISGVYAVVGAPYDNIDGNYNQGSAYIFKQSGSTWFQHAKLTASDGAANDIFGYAVGISGDYVIVGAYQDDISGNMDQGSAYIFKRTGSTWSQINKLTASDGSAGDNFGTSVSIAGQYAVVGARYDDVGGNPDQGSAYIFKRSGGSWSQQAMLVASDGSSGDLLGVSSSISGDYVIVGADGDNSGKGSAYIFKRTDMSWSEEDMIAASDGAIQDRFGYTVSISGDYVVVGAYGDDIGSNSFQGSAYIFKRTGTSWSQETKLLAEDGGADDYFAQSVHISGDYAFAGASNDQIGLNVLQGSLYVYSRSGTTWSQIAKLTASDGQAYDYFGASISMSGDHIIVGAGSRIDGNVLQGAAYLYHR